MKHQRICKCLSLCLAILILGTSVPLQAFAEDLPSAGKLLQNGSFETAKNNGQHSPSVISPWKTTAETNKIELFKSNNFYISDSISGYKVNLNPTDGTYAVELNADEESTLYQVVSTEPSSLYEWGLDHGSRTASETMALIIGPNQTVAPSKNWGEGYETADLNYPNPTLQTGYKYGKDQMMQMVAWLKATGVIGSTTDNEGIANNGQAIVLYSKPFAAHGGFFNNADNQPFSLTSSSVYTEKWCIWLMTDHNTTIDGATNPWGSYGLNEESAAENGGQLDLSKYYLYTVPSKQAETMFAFTSVENTIAPNKTFIDPTFGNFLDNVNFRLYHSLSGSTTAHGSAVVGSSDGSSEGEGASSGHAVTVGNSVATYVSDGENLQIQAKVASGDTATVKFAGVYYTVQSETGTSTSFVSATAWGEPTKDSSGNLLYTYSLESVTSAVNLHFVFIKSPLLTYDANGGKDYLCTPAGSNSATESPYVYSFKPTTTESGVVYIDPYTAHAPEGQNDAWKFMGWKLFDDNGAVEGLLTGVHSIACNYEQKTTAGLAATQNFVIIGEGETFTAGTQTPTGKAWSTEAENLYNASATGLTLVAQWRWRQAFVPQTNTESGYENSTEGGSVAIESVNAGDENYVAEYSQRGAKAYYAGVSETITATAKAEAGYYFDGWYDETGTQVSVSDELTYVEPKESIKTYYARFSPKIQQQFMRQIQVDGVWTTLEDDDARVPVLDHTSLREGLGTVVSATATNSDQYGIIGWYDIDGKPVDQSMVCNDGKTIRYAVSTEATYYARYVKAVTVNFNMQFVNQNSTLTVLASNNDYGLLSVETVNAIPRDVVRSKAYPSKGYQFVGWFDGDDTAATKLTGNAIDDTDAMVITPTATETPLTTYYARFAVRTDTMYTVKHVLAGYYSDGTSKTVTYTFYGTTGALALPTVMPNLSSYVGYAYSSGMPDAPQAITADGKLSFTLNYTKTPATLTYNANAPDNGTVTGTVAPTDGYVGCQAIVGTNDDPGFICTGYKFNGWNTAENGTGTAYAAGDAYLMQEASNTLYAQWVASDSVAYTVRHSKLNESDEESGIEEYIYYGSTGTTVTAVAKSYDGYTYQENYADTVKTGRITADGNLILKLYYTPNPTNLTYLANGGTGNDVIQNGVVNQSLNVTGGDAFTRPGYTFDGWKTLAGKTYDAGDPYILTAGNDVLLAQWSANTDTQYRIFHYAVSADGLSSTLADREDKTGTTGASVTAEETSIAGYTYKSDFNASGMKTSATGIIAGDGSLVLKLYYIPNTVKLSYDANGGIGSSTATAGRVGESVLVSANPFSRAGYTFAGWNTSAENTGTAYAQNSAYTLGTVDGVLYAQWTANTNTGYVVEHYQVNAEGTASALAARENLTGVTEQTATATAKTYQGYTYQANYNTNGMKTVSSGTIAGDGGLVLKLYYTPNPAHLYYYANDGTEESSIVPGFVDESKTVAANAFIRDGYTFTGWNTAANGSGTAYAAGSSFTLTADQNQNILYAQWTSIPVVPVATTLIYKANGGSGADVTVNGNVGETKLVANNPFIHEGHTFTGWNTAADGSGAVYAVGSSFTLTNGEDLLYAQWQKTSTSSGGTSSHTTLSYRANGGNGKNVVVNGSVGDTKTAADNPFTREGYTFTGWNTAADGSGTAYAVGSEYLLSSGANVLYAQWTATKRPSVLTDKHIAYIIGREDGFIHPDANITRGEVATILFRLLDETVREEYLTSVNSFSDMDSSVWCCKAVSTLAAMGIISGRNNGTFDRNASITRAEMAAMLARFSEAADTGEDKFSDISGHWAAAYINSAANYGWILGGTDGRFRPNDAITRAETVTMVNRVLNRQPESAADLLGEMTTWPDNLDPTAWYYLAFQEATNSHDYEMKADQVHEYWLSLQENPDWKQYETHGFQF